MTKKLKRLKVRKYLELIHDMLPEMLIPDNFDFTRVTIFFNSKIGIRFDKMYDNPKWWR